MIYIIFLVCSASGAKSSRFLNPKTDVIKETIQDYNYMANLNQSILFQYANYYGTYSMSLKSGGNNEIPLAQSIDGNFSQGCHPYSRKIAQQQLFNTTPRLPFETPETLQGIITSVYAANYFVFILRSDFKLFIMKIDYDKQNYDIIDFTQYQIVELKKEFDNINGKSQLLNSELLCSQYLKQGGQIFCFIISEHGVLQFSYNQIDENMVSISKLFNLKNETINHIFFSDENELLFITYPTAGVDVYKMNPNGDLELITNILPNGLTNLKQAKMDETSNYLFILNERLGVHIYNFNKQTQSFSENNMYIYIKGGDTFDFHRNTMFILAQTEDSLQYALEIFIDFKLEQYYFNQIHQFGQDVYDVYVGNLFVLFVGSDRLHQVIYHSVYKDFDAQHEQFYFSDIDLIQVDELNPPWKQQLFNGKAFEDGILSKVNLTYTETFLVGISENEVSLFRIRLIPPWVLCTAFEPKIEYYSLTLNSTVCPSLKDQVQNQFKYCQVQANFSFEGVSVLMYEEHQSYFILVVIILVSMILILFITLLICRKRLYQKLSDQDEKQIEEYSNREQKQLDTENIKTMI
ncbi:unnamed protein product (macronuclear) [Paramecium tetraurelia]|uniref:Transmembrane protein n=1 Tax=Paramecium tetraurelia TaxID=5888 RepID=A0CWT5_PARTE|nr:uncharacterized protein GSPATT00001455001 [Paramecium tetraurelia]CAK75252.1 unnamed protein product [Paramecium tetraurelia]|eukprot:XP_001442649.1 hypothetical protein (macronuclear) [Paramecium tetraurelia strain d4-2]